MRGAWRQREYFAGEALPRSHFSLAVRCHLGATAMSV
jgi:hypothetical protein